MGNLRKKLVATKIDKKLVPDRVRQPLGERFFRSGPLFGESLGPTWVPEWALWADFRDFLATCWVTCDLSSLEDAREACRDRFGMS